MTPSSRFVVLWSAALSCGCAWTADRPTGPRLLPLEAADVWFDEGFTYLSSARELSDQRVIITDPREGRIVAIDPNSDSILPVARHGPGPQEWSNAVALLPLGGDSSLQVDLLARRWLVFGGLNVVESIPPDAPVMVKTQSSVFGASAAGLVLDLARPTPDSASADYRVDADSIAVVLVSLATGVADTVAMLREAPGTVHVALDEDGISRPVSLSRPAFAVGEQAALFRDGWLAIARLDPYRVDWRRPDGTFVLGEPTNVAPIPVSQEEQAAYRARNQSLIEQLERAPSPMREVLMRRFTEFPAVIPPFASEALLAGDDGRLYIRRTVTIGHESPEYDVFTRDGGVQGRLTLADGERIVTVSRKHTYIVWTDSLGLERLRRHPLVGANR